MREYQDLTATQVATRTAARFARKVFWADPEDLRQEAVLAALSAERTFKPEIGVPFGAYAWRACVLALRAYCLRNSSPVSETQQRLDTLKRVHRADFPGLEDERHTPDEAYDAAAWAQAVRRHVFFVVSREHGFEAALFAERMLLDEHPAQDIAKETGVPLSKLYRISREARESLASNAMLFDMWRHHA